MICRVGYARTPYHIDKSEWRHQLLVTCHVERGLRRERMGCCPIVLHRFYMHSFVYAEPGLLVCMHSGQGQ
jgi:hypothetical protein